MVIFLKYNYSCNRPVSSNNNNVFGRFLQSPIFVCYSVADTSSESLVICSLSSPNAHNLERGSCMHSDAQVNKDPSNAGRVGLE